MDSSGRIIEWDDAVPAPPRLVTGEAIPGDCRPAFVLLAMERLSGALGNVEGHSALAPLSLFERGYVLGVRAVRALAGKAEP